MMRDLSKKKKIKNSTQRRKGEKKEKIQESVNWFIKTPVCACENSCLRAWAMHRIAPTNDRPLKDVPVEPGHGTPCPYK
jgi:hypothetical protein